MADAVQTFVSVCRGGLNTGSDVLSLGAQTPGAARQLVNYEPNLEGGYRRLSGFANNYGTVGISGNAGTGAVLGVCVANGINDGVFAARKPTSGNNYLHRWDATNSVWVAITCGGSPTMSNVTKVRFTEINFGTPKIVLTDGINPAATYDGTNYVQITDSNALTDPTMSEEFQTHLFLAGDPAKPSILTFSAPTAETDFNPANGANEINVGFEIISIKKFRNVLYIFGTNNIKRLVGNNDSDFRLETVTSNLGCLATDSVVELGGDLLFLSPDGIRPIGGTNKIGDVNLETISKNIQSQINNTINNETLNTLSSVIIRNKSQFRYIFSTSGSTGIIGALRENQGNFAYEFGTLFGVEGTCADSGYIGQTEIVIHGAANGKVYQQESGTNFDTSNILSIYKTPYIYMEDPQKRKLYYDAATYMTAEGAFNLSVGVSYDYDNTDILMPDNTTIVNTDPAAYYNTWTNIATYDSADIYDGNPAPVEGASFSGSGKAISLTYVTDDTNASHSIQGFTVTYGLGDVR